MSANDYAMLLGLVVALAAMVVVERSKKERRRP